MQCAYYVHGAVMRALGCGPADVHVHQDVTGGGFGGKEAFPSILGCQVAVAAKKADKPVRCIFDRREDLEFTSKRHPSLCTYKVAVKDGKITAMDIDVKFNGGAYTTLSAVVLQRGIICADGVYNVENLHVRGRRRRFRGCQRLRRRARGRADFPLCLSSSGLQEALYPSLDFLYGNGRNPKRL